MKNQNKYRGSIVLFGHTAKNAGGKFGRSRMLYWRKWGVENWERRANREFVEAR